METDLFAMPFREAIRLVAKLEQEGTLREFLLKNHPEYLYSDGSPKKSYLGQMLVHHRNKTEIIYLNRAPFKSIYDNY